MSRSAIGSRTAMRIGGSRVWRKGCARSREQANALRELVRSVDDVEMVVDELHLKPR